MLRIKVPIGKVKVEIEAETEKDLEIALRVAGRTLASPTQGASIPLWESAEGHPSPRSPAKPQPGSNRRVPYKGAQAKADRLYTALKHLGQANGFQEVTAGRIISFIDQTGERFKSRAKDRGASARQMMRNDPRFHSTGTGWKLVEWIEETKEPEQQVPESEDAYEQEGETTQDMPDNEASNSHPTLPPYHQPH